MMRSLVYLNIVAFLALLFTLASVAMAKTEAGVSGIVEYVENDSDGAGGAVLFLSGNLVVNVPAAVLQPFCSEPQIGQCISLSLSSPENMIAQSCARVSCDLFPSQLPK